MPEHVHELVSVLTARRRLDGLIVVPPMPAPVPVTALGAAREVYRAVADGSGLSLERIRQAVGRAVVDGLPPLALEGVGAIDELLDPVRSIIGQLGAAIQQALETDRGIISAFCAVGYAVSQQLDELEKLARYHLEPQLGEWLTTEQVAKVLQIKDTRTVIAQANHPDPQRLPHVRIGRQYRYPANAIRELARKQAEADRAAREEQPRRRRKGSDDIPGTGSKAPF